DDGNGGTATATVTVIVNPSHHPPIANAGPDQTIIEDNLVTLDGSGSTLGEGAPEDVSLTYSWSQVSGPSVTLSDPSAINPTFTAPLVTVDTTVTLQLIVNDGTYDSAPDTVTIAIRNIDHPPTADDQAISVDEDGSSVGIALTGADLDSDPITFAIVTPPSHGVLSGT